MVCLDRTAAGRAQAGVMTITQMARPGRGNHTRRSEHHSVLARAVARRTRLKAAAVVIVLDAARRTALQQAGGVRSRLARARGIAPILLPPLLSNGSRGGLTRGSGFRLRGGSLSNALAHWVKQRQRQLGHRRAIQQGTCCVCGSEA